MLVQCGAVSFSFFQFNGLHLCIFGSEFILRYYGIVLMLGAVAGGWLATYELKRRNYDPEVVWDLLVYLIIGGVIGARLWHIFTPTQSSGLTTSYYLTHPLDMLDIRKGGLGIPGTVIGGLVALYIYVRNNPSISFSEWVDIAAPSLALGQAIGRWGNFFNQELYGSATNLPWGIHITDPYARVAPYNDLIKYPLDVTRFHPLFLYESILNLAIMLLLMWIMRQFVAKLKQGDVFLTYLICYPTVRFFLEFIRVDYPVIGGIDPNQAFMALVAVCATIALVWRHRAGEGNEQPMLQTAEGNYPVRAIMDDKSKPTTRRTVKKSVVRKKAGASDKKPGVRKPATRKTAKKTNR